MVGDPIFDEFYASQVQFMADAIKTQTFVGAAGAALLDRIGPAIILTHSQSGPFGWLIGDARPKLVKAIVAAEPSGPPFYDVAFLGAPPTSPTALSAGRGGSPPFQSPTSHR